MPNYESNKKNWKDNECECECNHHKKEDCCCELNKKDWKDDDCKCDHHKEDHHDKKEECCCKKSMKEALNLLANRNLTSDATFTGFTFIGDSYIVGSPLKALSADDNIFDLTASFLGFESCNCDLIKISSTSDIFYPIPNANPAVPGLSRLGLNVNRISLCDIEAVVIRYNLIDGATQAEFEADLIALLDKFKEKCRVKCDECCCNEGICKYYSERIRP